MVFIRRQGTYIVSEDEMAKTCYVFDGAENSITSRRVYSSDWLCDYDMQYYPFDTQVLIILILNRIKHYQIFQKCLLIFSPSRGSSLQLNTGNSVYSGKRELTQYFIR